MLAPLYTSSGNHRSARIGTALPDVCSSAGSVDSWWEWVPSKANVADLPVRDPSTWDGEARGVVAKIYSRIDAQGFGRRELRLPTSAQLGNPAEMLRGVRVLAARVAAGSPF